MKRYFVLLCLIMGLVACGGGSEGMTVTDAWVRPSPMMEGAGAAYMVLENSGTAEDSLLSVSSDVAAIIELHETKEVEGVMEMSPVAVIVVPGNGQAELKPGGYHIMLIGLTEPLTVGQQVELTLHFEKAGDMKVLAEVREG